MLTENNDFKKYGVEFQRGILRLFLQDKAFTEKIKFIIKPDYFDNKYDKWFCEQLLVYVHQYGIAPSDSIFTGLIKSKIQIPHAYLKAWELVLTADLQQKEFYEEQALLFCRQKHASDKLEKAMVFVQAGKPNEARKEVGEAFTYEDNHSREFDLKKDFAQTFLETPNKPVPTPFAEINEISQGGPGQGRLCLAVAPSHFGKSSFLTAQARTAALAGKNVIYFTLEDSEKSVARRLLAGLVEVNQEDLADHSQKITLAVNKLGSNIKIIHVRATKAYIETLKSKVQEQKTQGFFPDLIIIDAINQIKLPGFSSSTGDNDKFEKICELTRDWADEEQLPIWSAAQTNRGGFNNLQSGEVNIGKAIEIFQVADFILLFAQDKDLKAVDEAWAYLIKNRLGASSKALKVSHNANQGIFESVGYLMDMADVYNLAATKTLISGIESLQNKLTRHN